MRRGQVPGRERIDCVHDVCWWQLLPSRCVGGIAVPGWHLFEHGWSCSIVPVHGLSSGLIVRGRLDGTRAVPKGHVRAEPEAGHVYLLSCGQVSGRLRQGGLQAV